MRPGWPGEKTAQYTPVEHAQLPQALDDYELQGFEREALFRALVRLLVVGFDHVDALVEHHLPGFKIQLFQLPIMLLDGLEQGGYPKVIELGADVEMGT